MSKYKKGFYLQDDAAQLLAQHIKHPSDFEEATPLPFVGVVCKRNLVSLPVARDSEVSNLTFRTFKVKSTFSKNSVI